MSLKYSSLSEFEKDWKSLNNGIDLAKFEKRQMSAALSHEVMHNILGYIPEDYLNLKKKGEKLTDQNSLGL